jgi:ribosomal protein S27AE
MSNGPLHDRNDEFDDGFSAAVAALGESCPRCGHPAVLGDGASGSPRCVCAACGHCQHKSQSARGDYWSCNDCGALLHPLNIPDAIP